ncbi:Os05g0141066 [Oryza sativa Japonica Group]|uniref:Os05g0141066 protein n=1 Tax=Oryza sativa subsp. japonica TaxID=39947 RepID=A0A0P0WHP2_ORYSJ|nr:Os05g0141066 [Oryza sativa Japonica Group]
MQRGGEDERAYELVQAPSARSPRSSAVGHPAFSAVAVAVAVAAPSHGLEELEPAPFGFAAVGRGFGRPMGRSGC